MNDYDQEQNLRIREVESRLNTIENQVSELIGKLDSATSMLKVVAIGLGAMVGLDIQGMVN